MTAEDKQQLFTVALTIKFDRLSTGGISHVVIILQKNEVTLTSFFCGTPGRSRTYNLFLRTELLYPIELPRRTLVL